MLPEIAAEELEECVDSVAAAVLEAAGIVDPPVDSIVVARALGIELGRDDRQSGRARFVRLGAARGRGGQGAILLGREPRAERRQWAVAHEIGECWAHRVFERLGVDPRAAPVDARETVANRLASAILLPAEWFAQDGREQDWDLMTLKARYATASHELIARRMLDFLPDTIITVFDHGKISLRRGNFGRRPPPLFPIEMRLWQAVHEQSSVCDLRDGALSVRGWPIHEPGWQREILLTTVEDAD